MAVKIGWQAPDGRVWAITTPNGLPVKICDGDDTPAPAPVDLPALIVGGGQPVGVGLLLTKPASGSGPLYVGDIVTIRAGRWSGAPSVQRDLMQGTAIYLANVTNGQTVALTDGAAFDGKTLWVREIGRANSFIVTAESMPKRTVRYRKPVAVGTVPAQAYTEGTGTQSLNVTGYFSGAAIVWSISAGAIIEDGVAFFSTATAGTTAITVTATNSGGSATQTFNVVVSAAAPSLSGTALVDQSYSQNTGTRTYATAGAFLGSALTYSLISPPAGVTIDSATGVVSTVTTSLIASSVITVRATNAGGYVETTFDLEVVTAATNWWPTGAVLAFEYDYPGGGRYYYNGVEYASVAAMSAFYTAGTGTAADVVDLTGVASSLGAATLFAEGTISTDTTTNQYFAMLSDGTDNNRFAVRRINTALAGTVATANVTRADVQVASLGVNGAKFRMAASGAANLTNASASGSLGTASTDANFPTGLNKLLLRNNHAGTRYIGANGALDKVYVIAGASANSTLASLSGGATVPPELSNTPIPLQAVVRNAATAHTYPASTAFFGTVTAYSVSGDGVTIDSTTGLLTFDRTVTRAERDITVTATNGSYGSVSRTFRASCQMKTIAASDVTISIRPNPGTGSATGFPAGALTWWVNLAESNIPETVTQLWWRRSAHVAGTGPGTGYYPMVRHPNAATDTTLATMWLARTYTNAFGDPVLGAFCNATSLIGTSVTHHFMWSADPSGNRVPAPTGRVATFDATANTATSAAHGFINGHAVTVAGADVPLPLVAGTTYYVIATTPDTFQLAATFNGAAIDLADAGSGTITVSGKNREFSPASAAKVQTLTLNGTAPSFTNDPTITGGTSIGSVLTAVDGTATGDPTPTITGQWRRAGVAIDGATDLTYTADQAGAYTYRNTASNGYTPNATATSNTITVGGAGEVVFATPTTEAEFITAFKNCPAGQIIEIAGGRKAWNYNNYSPATVLDRDPAIIIRPVDRDDPPIFEDNFLDISNQHGVTLDGLHFLTTTADERDVITPTALVFRSCNRIKVTNCHFQDYFRGIFNGLAKNNASASTCNFDHEYSYNTIEGMRCDGFGLYNIGGRFHCHHNKIFNTDINPAWTSAKVPPGNFEHRHPDAYQFAVTDAKCTGADNVIIEDNYSECNQIISSNGMHGILIGNEDVMKGDQSFSTCYHRNLMIRRNYFKGSNVEGTSIAAVKNSTIRDNLYDRQTGQSTAKGQTPCVYTLENDAGDSFIVNVTVANNCWPLGAGETALYYGEGGSTKLTIPASEPNLINDGTTKPVGWSGFDVAKGIYGQYGRG